MAEAMQILERVNAFYSSAFSQLVTFTVGLLALVGVLVPLAIAAYQNRQLKHDQRTLTDKIENELSIARQALSEQLAKDLASRDEAMKSLIESVKAEIAQEIKKIDGLGSARSFHLQALTHRESSPASSASDCLTAACLYAKGGDERNLKSVLSILGDCIERVTMDYFKFYDFEEDSQSAIAALETLNANGRYTEDVRSIRRSIQEAKTRKPPSTRGAAA